eukprot:5068363-Pyramimonas_sp.AAC.1
MNLAHFADRPNPLAAECITSCPVADFYADCFLKIVTAETGASGASARRPQKSALFTETGDVPTPPDATAWACARRPGASDLRTLSPARASSSAST